MEIDNEVKIAMVTAASQALDYQAKNPNADSEEIIRYIMKELRVKGDEKVGAIVGASRALKEKQKTNRPNKIIIQEIMDQSNEILMSIGEN